ncbi:glycoside hydrolase family 18 protein [Hypoxylon crocopeplum]|nr:glycoside hydrolase family 18 protein [Hypoxylon crocopeplum]
MLSHQILHAFASPATKVKKGIYERDYQPTQLPVSQVNQVLYAFANLSPNGTVYALDPYADLQKRYDNDHWNDTGRNAHGCVKQLYLLKKANRHLKVLLSVGGWTYSANFADVSSTVAARSTFAKSAVTLMEDWGFDGLDVDWEYPADETQADNMLSLLRATRDELDIYSAQYADRYHFLLTASVPAAPKQYYISRLDQMVSLIDYFNLMAGTSYGHQANLYANPNNPASTPYSTNAAVESYLCAKIPANKIVLGIPLYGRSFEATNSLEGAYSGIDQVLPRQGATELYNKVADASYSYNNVSKELISYDNVHMIKRKIMYLQDKRLGGIIFWEVSDDRYNNANLVTTSFRAQGSASLLHKKENLLSYPLSRYDNIRNNMPRDH